MSPPPWNPISRRYVGDCRMLLVLGRMFLLQAGHPVIAAGVAEHSVFRTDPWGRFERSMDALMGTTYGPDPDRLSAEIREMHKRIKGVDSHGRNYHSLEPEPYFWVMATTIDSVIQMADRFATPMSPAELPRFYDEQREQARMLGLRDRDMPATWPAFQSYYAEMLHTRLQDSETIHHVLEQIADAPAPPKMPAIAWKALGPASGRLGGLTNLGTLPPIARERWGISWSTRQERQLRLIAETARVAIGALPPERRLLPRARDAKRPRPLRSEPSIAAAA